MSLSQYVGWAEFMRPNIKMFWEHLIFKRDGYIPITNEFSAAMHAPGVTPPRHRARLDGEPCGRTSRTAKPIRDGYSEAP